MHRILLFCLAVCFSAGMLAQPIYLDQFDDGSAPAQSTSSWDISEADDELLVSGLGPKGDFDGIWFDLGGQTDISASPKVYLRGRTSDTDTEIRVDLVDGMDRFANTEPITFFFNQTDEVYEFDFGSVNLGDVDLTTIKAVYMYINPGVNSWSAQLALDYISIGEAIDGPIVSDIYQDLMDSDSSVANFGFASDGYTVSRDVEDDVDYVTISGDGSSAQWTLLAYQLRPAPEFIETTVDMSNNTLIYVKARAGMDGTALRVDVQDGDNISSNATAANNILTTEWAVYEYDLTGAVGLAVAGTNCTEQSAPCPVDLTAIKELLIYPNPSGTNFADDIDIDWISFGVNLDGEEPPAPLIYSDDFDNELPNFVGPVTGFLVSESESSLFIRGDGNSSNFGTVSYTFNDPVEMGNPQDTARMARLVDFTQGDNKLFVRARSLDGAPHPVRIDVVDTLGALTDFKGVTKTITNEWQVLTYNYTGNYQFADYGEGNDDCSPDNLCTVDGTTIGSILMFIRPNEAEWRGEIEIDWISVGQPLEEITETAPGIVNYSDELTGAEGAFSGTYNGVNVSVTDGVANITSNGVTDDFHQVRYTLRDADGNAAKADIQGSNDKLFISARVLNTDSSIVRIDLRDEGGFETSNAGRTATIKSDEFQTFEFDYTNAYIGIDGGYGGTNCNDPVCDVDPVRISSLVIYPDPGEDRDLVGTIEIDWISFGEPISVGVRDFAELEGLRIFPNPAKDMISVDFDLAAASDISVTMFDGLGRRQLFQNLGNRTAGRFLESLDVSNLPVGTYYMQVMVNGRATRAVSIVKQ